MIKPLHWNEGNATVELLDQTALPLQEKWITIDSVDAMAEAIRSLRIRGAPAIGIAAAYGVALAAGQAPSGQQTWAATFDALDQLRETRPTASNLFSALERMRVVAVDTPLGRSDYLRDGLVREARAIEREEEIASRSIGQHGLSLLADGMKIMTHCHAGGIATAGLGTALAPIHLGHQRGIQLHVYVDETRPLLQGARITAWELQKAGIPCTLICDSMSAHVMRRKGIDAVIVGTDRVAANGDVANKIGTYGLALHAKAHDVPFYVALPASTIDLSTETGDDIPIEERDPNEVTALLGKRTAPHGVAVCNPAFDVTPAHLITAFITDRGIIDPPFEEAMKRIATG